MRGISKFQLVKTQLKLDGDTSNLQKAYDYMDKLSKNRNFDWRKLWADLKINLDITHRCTLQCQRCNRASLQLEVKKCW